MFVSPDKHCDKEFRKVFFEKNLEMWFVDRWGEIVNCMIMKKEESIYQIRKLH